MRERRAELMGVMIFHAVKIATEADIEIQEAIDFMSTNRREIAELHCLKDIAWQPKGIIVVASPWNFPCSIPVGGIAAALAAGNYRDL